MNIKQVSYCLVGSVVLAASSIACTNTEYRDKAKEQAAKYLNGYDLLKAERMERQQVYDDYMSGAKVAYWDSLLVEAKTKEAYFAGQQMIKDSVNRKFFRKNKYKANLDTIIERNLMENLTEDYSKYTNAETFMRLRDKAPSNKSAVISELPYQTHYWNLITLAGKQQEAYNKGAANERAKIHSKRNR